MTTYTPSLLTVYCIFVYGFTDNSTDSIQTIDKRLNFKLNITKEAHMLVLIFTLLGCGGCVIKNTETGKQSQKEDTSKDTSEDTAADTADK